jgi:hypothetical protein
MPNTATKTVSKTITIPRKSTKAAKTASLPLGSASDPPNVLENLNVP